MSNELQLKSLIIQNFRGFENFQINQLGRVNLIVGKNNVGKTSLLEAILLYANRGSSATIYDILKDRDEHHLLGSMEDSEFSEEEFFALKNLFFGREDFIDSTKTIHIGENENKKITLMGQWFNRYLNEDGVPIPRPIKFEEVASSENPFPGINVRVIENPNITKGRIERYNRKISRIISNPSDINCNIVYSNKVDIYNLSKWRDSSLIDGLENHVIDALKIIDSEVESVNMVSYQNNKSSRLPSPIPIVKLSRYKKFIPMKSLGDGMNRVFAIILALVNSRNGICLIDEIENGLHYSIQKNFWNLIFELSEKLNIQVFATTHSKDNLNSFIKTSISKNDIMGVAIRLGMKADSIVSTTFNEDDLETIYTQDIEVR